MDMFDHQLCMNNCFATASHFHLFFFFFKSLLNCANIIKLPESLSALIQLHFHFSEIVLAHDSKDFLVLFQTCRIADAVRGKMEGSF